MKYAAGFPVAAIRYCLQGSRASRWPKWITSPCRAIPGRAWARSCFTRCACRGSRANAPRCWRNSWAFRKRWRRLRHRSEAASRAIPSRRAPPGASGQRILCVAVRPSGACFPPTAWAISPAPCGRPGEGKPHAHSGRRRLPAFAGHVLHGDHAVSRLLEIRRRIQSDGPGRLWRAGISRRVSPHRSQQRLARVSAWAWNTSRTTARART